jgi:Transketolase, N-terminal subunit
MKNSEEYLNTKAYQYRKRFLDIFTRLGFGHLTSAFSWAEIATVLLHEFYVQGTDHLFVSKGHGIGILFPIYEDLGLFTKSQVDDMIRIGGSNEEIKKLVIPGFDFYGGSLGIGIGMAAGYAKGEKLSGKDAHVYCLVGDAECYEGSVWEALNFAGFQKLDNLIVIIDRNKLGCSDFTEHMLALEPLDKKLSAFNWDVQVIDGHNVEEIYEAVKVATARKNGRPHCIVANTVKGKGLDYVIDRPLMHGYVPQGADIDKAYHELRLYV